MALELGEEEQRDDSLPPLLQGLAPYGRSESPPSMLCAEDGQAGTGSSSSGGVRGATASSPK